MSALRIAIVTLLLLASSARAQSDTSISDRSREEVGSDEFISATIEPVAIDTLAKILVYPETAKRAGIEGDVELMALVGKDGKVMRVRIERSSNFIFEKPARDAMYKMRYRPATNSGKPVSYWVREKVSFRLYQGY
jgi:TonB family protein